MAAPPSIERQTVVAKWLGIRFDGRKADWRDWVGLIRLGGGLAIALLVGVPWAWAPSLQLSAVWSDLAYDWLPQLLLRTVLLVVFYLAFVLQFAALGFLMFYRNRIARLPAILLLVALVAAVLNWHFYVDPKFV